jgi:hypothetical protein
MVAAGRRLHGGVAKIGGGAAALLESLELLVGVLAFEGYGLGCGGWR